jgi:xylulokinase
MMLEPKDFLNFRLTGNAVADTVTYSRYDRLRVIAPPAPDRLERGLGLLALRRVDPWAVVGHVTCTDAPFSRLRGVPVFAGAMDAWASAVGSGAVRPGQGYDIAGTSEVAGLLTRSRFNVPGLVSLVWGPDLHQIGGPTQAGADCAAWCHDVFRVAGDLATAVERAGSLPPVLDRPLFLPYLAGERTPLWRSDVRGALHGVSRTHGADDFVWATLEGVAMAVRDILRLAREGTGEAMTEVRVSGGGARSNAWCQMKADVLGVPLIRTTHAETGVIGTAMAAALGLGWHPSLATAADAMCPVERVFEPRFAPIATRMRGAMPWHRRMRR